MTEDELIAAVESIVFASGDPITLREVKTAFGRALKNHTADERDALLEQIKPAIGKLEEKWKSETEVPRGFHLIKVAEGYTFRSRPEHAHFIRALKETRPIRLSKPALETLSVVAYRQPVTKTEVDYVRGVDSGGTLRVLLEKGLLRIVGKKDEPGRPLLYGTTKEFLSLFNIPNLKSLPSLRSYQELDDASHEKLTAFDEKFSEALKEASAKLKESDASENVADIADALAALEKTESAAKEAFASKGIELEPSAD